MSAINGIGANGANSVQGSSPLWDLVCRIGRLILNLFRRLFCCGNEAPLRSPIENGLDFGNIYKIYEDCRDGVFEKNNRISQVVNSVFLKILENRTIDESDGTDLRYQDRSVPLSYDLFGEQNWSIMNTAFLEADRALSSLNFGERGLSLKVFVENRLDFSSSVRNQWLNHYSECAMIVKQYATCLALESPLFTQEGSDRDQIISMVDGCGFREHLVGQDSFREVYKLSSNAKHFVDEKKKDLCNQWNKYIDDNPKSRSTAAAAPVQVSKSEDVAFVPLQDISQYSREKLAELIQRAESLLSGRYFDRQEWVQEFPMVAQAASLCLFEQQQAPPLSKNLSDDDKNLAKNYYDQFLSYLHPSIKNKIVLEGYLYDGAFMKLAVQEWRRVYCAILSIEKQRMELQTLLTLMPTDINQHYHFPLWTGYCFKEFGSDKNSLDQEVRYLLAVHKQKWTRMFSQSRIREFGLAGKATASMVS